MGQFDVTQDLKGCFWGGDDWKDKWQELRERLENVLDTSLTNTGNSFESCFQYVEKLRPGKVHRRIKIYNKLLQLLQSRTAMMGLGMNTDAIFNSGV